MLKVLHVDVETAPIQAYVWGLWKNNVGMNQIISDWFMLTWSAKWHGDDVVYGDKLSSSEAIEQDDKRIMYSLWKMLDEADIIVGHNLDKFDRKKINTRFLVHEMSPPSPYRTIDTLKVAKRHFGFSSNRLDYLGKMLGVGRKIDTGGFELWADCMKGKEEALAKMLEYNQQDVILLEDVYNRLAPYHATHPNHGATMEGIDEPVCPKCGSTHLQKRGYAFTNTSRYQRYRCTDCGGWSRGRENIRGKEAMRNTLQGL